LFQESFEPLSFLGFYDIIKDVINKYERKKLMTNYNQNSSQEVAEKKYKLLRFSGNKSFFEIMTYAFNINKVAFQLTNYDTNNSSKNVVITCFLTFDEILAMCHDILSGRFVQEIQAMQNNAQASGKNFFGKQIHIGGGNDKNGRLISRTLSVSMAKNVGNVMFVASLQDGKKTSTGGISPTNQNKKSASYIMPFSELKAMAIYLSEAIKNYLRIEMERGIWAFSPNELPDLGSDEQTTTEAPPQQGYPQQPYGNIVPNQSQPPVNTLPPQNQPWSAHVNGSTTTTFQSGQGNQQSPSFYQQSQPQQQFQGQGFNGTPDFIDEFPNL
jgi:hypothetical protein